MSDLSLDHAAPPRRLGALRIGIGLLAGFIVWGLKEAGDQKVWPSTLPPLLGALAMAALLTPFVLVGGLGALRARTLAVWASVVAAVYAFLGWHDLSRGFADAQHPWPSVEIVLFGAGGLFIAHHLVAGSDADRQVIARYPRYFELAWKHGVQLALSAAFVGVFWIVLFLGGALFALIGIDQVNELLRKDWFAIPATATMYAAAVHLTDVRSSLIKGIRTVALTLLSWLLPILTVLGAAFLLALPFTGLDPLWKTRSAAAILLCSAAVLIVLINAAWQDGEPDGAVSPVLRWTARLAAGLLAPLVLLAGYALFLRIGQHGLTPDRVVGIACCLAGAVYAAGYLAAAVRPGRWMRWVAHTNIAAAFVVLGLLLAIFSPLADPARLSVDDQIGRLTGGKVAGDKFDYAFLRWEAGRYGREALARLAKRPDDTGRRAKEALARKERWAPAERVDEPAVQGDPAMLQVAGGAALPASFLKDGGWLVGDARQLGCTLQAPCPTALVDLNDDGADEIVVAGKTQAVVYTHARWNDWTVIRQIHLVACPGFIDDVKAGKVAGAVSPWKDLVVGGKRIALEEQQDDCDPASPPDRMVVHTRTPPSIEDHGGKVGPVVP